MEFEVKKVEFELAEDVDDIKFIGLFYVFAEKYVPRIKIFLEKSVKFRFKKEISLNTLSNILAKIQKNTPYAIKEIKHKVEDQKVEVKIEKKNK